MRRFAHMQSEVELQELDLAPMLSLMVTLIPILLLSSVFINIMVVETNLPQAVQSSIANNKKDDKQVKLTVKVRNNRSIVITQGSKALKVPAKDKQIDLVAFHKKLLVVKKNTPHVFSLEVLPGEKISYQEIISVMDNARKLNRDEGKISVPQRGKQPAYETIYLFPNINFSNILEG